MKKVCWMIRAVLLALPALTVALWAWSHYECVDFPSIDTLHYPRIPRGGEVFAHASIEEGGLHIRYCRVIPGAPIKSRSSGPWHGFYYQMGTDTRYAAGAFVEQNLHVPMWAVLPFTLVYPGIWMVRYGRGPGRRKRRQSQGLCLKCGYNLTGNSSGICPECGLPREPAKIGASHSVL